LTAAAPSRLGATTSRNASAASAIAASAVTPPPHPGISGMAPDVAASVENADIVGHPFTSRSLTTTLRPSQSSRNAGRQLSAPRNRNHHLGTIALSQIGEADAVVAPGRNGACRKSKRSRLTSTAPRLQPPARDSRGREDVRCAMTDVIVEIVDRLIASEEKMLDNDDYDWPTSRAALERILAHLEAQSLGHPDLKRLRWFIAISDEAWKARLRSKSK
jgi:hypothetical protein